MDTATLDRGPQAARVHGWATAWQDEPDTCAERADRTVEYLPFRVRRVVTRSDLAQAVAVRSLAYGRHLPPALTKALRTPEKADTQPDTVILLAESKLDGSALGTMRIQTNAVSPLGMEQSIRLPDWMAGHHLAETTRLAVAGDRSGHLVRLALVKAGYQFCVMQGIRYMVITARAPVDRQYERLLFQDVFPGMGYMPLEHVFNLPHRVMCFDVEQGEALWTRHNHPLLHFFTRTQHPDICLNG